MKLKIEITIDNAAFEHQGDEAARILHALAEEITDNEHLRGLNKRLFDLNGNRVGEAKVTR